MSDARLRELYSQVLARSETGDRGACISAEQMSALVERALPEAEQLATLDHIMSCAACQREFELLRALHQAARRPRRALRIYALAASVALIASAALLARAAWWRDSPDVMRGGVPALTLVSPADDAAVNLPVQLIWRSVEGAARYRVELLDSTGAVAFSATTPDTALTVSRSTPRLLPGSYRWWVAAERREAGPVRASPRRLRIQTR